MKTTPRSPVLLVTALAMVVALAVAQPARAASHTITWDQYSLMVDGQPV